MLLDLAVHTGCQLKIGRIQTGGNVRTERLERVKPLAYQHTAIAHLIGLDHPLADVVAAGVAKYIVQRIRLRHPARLLTDDYGQLAFKVDILPLPRVDDRLLRVEDGGGGQHEQHRLIRRRCPAFFSMGQVVQPHPDQARHPNRRQHAHIVQVGCLAALVETLEGTAGQLADGAVLFQNAVACRTVGTVAQNLHC